MMYRIEYLPIAMNDLVEIASYIGVKLDNPTAAEKLADEIADSVAAAAGNPYMYPLYIPVRPLTYEYRKIVVGNYCVFYRVDETAKILTVARVIYARRDIGRILK